MSLCLYVILSSVPLLPCLLHTLSIMSFCLPFLCYHVFTYSVHYVILSSVPLLPCLLHTLSLRSFCLPFLCYHVFYILYPFGHSVFRSSVTMSFTYSVPYVFMSSVPLLPCLLHTLSLMSLCHSGFINVKYFYKLPILSVNSEWQVGQYLPFLSRTFRDKFVSINKTIVYKIKQRRQNSENHKFIYERRTGKEMKERKNRCKKGVFVYIFHNKALFLPYSSHLTS